MATITATDVKALRDRTGAGMMDCKTALTEANGDMDEAITILRKKGMAQVAKKAGRAMKEGLVGVRLNGDATATLVEIRWPSGAVQTFENVKARAALIATESTSGAGAGTRR